MVFTSSSKVLELRSPFSFRHPVPVLPGSVSTRRPFGLGLGAVPGLRAGAAGRSRPLRGLFCARLVLPGGRWPIRLPRTGRGASAPLQIWGAVSLGRSLGSAGCGPLGPRRPPGSRTAPTASSVAPGLGPCGDVHPRPGPGIGATGLEGPGSTSIGQPKDPGSGRKTGKRQAQLSVGPKTNPPVVRNAPGLAGRRRGHHGGHDRSLFPASEGRRGGRSQGFLPGAPLNPWGELAPPAP